MALVTRLTRICCSFVLSVWIRAGTSSARSTANFRPFSSALGRSMCTTSDSSSSNLHASMFRDM